jgi:hypothetical protein
MKLSLLTFSFHHSFFFVTCEKCKELALLITNKIDNNETIYLFIGGNSQQASSWMWHGHYFFIASSYLWLSGILIIKL